MNFSDAKLNSTLWTMHLFKQEDCNVTTTTFPRINTHLSQCTPMMTETSFSLVAEPFDSSSIFTATYEAYTGSDYGDVDFHANLLQSSPSKIDYNAIRPYLVFQTIDRIKKTLAKTTQSVPSI
eukprot:scaffold133960_cov79-Attheya_sp.AAC.1